MKNLTEIDFKQIKKLHKIYYDEEIPRFIEEIAGCPEMQRLKNIGQNCGRDYISRKLKTFSYNYSRFEHSIGVALIIWNFTKSKKQTIAGLLHDIATPTFAHVIDYYNGDAENQTSTEKHTEEIISNSKKINEWIQKNKISIEEITDYSIYPIADNDIPKLSADRLEYNLYTATARNIITFKEARDIYADILICNNEYGENEMCFQTIEMAKKMALIALENGEYMSSNVSNITNNFLSSILKLAIKEGVLKYKMFENKTEQEIVEILDTCENSRIKEKWDFFKNFDKIRTTTKRDKNAYYSVNSKGKKRYIDPIVKLKKGVKRITEIDENLKIKINDFVNMNLVYYNLYK